ncbi:MAG: hypothetical protein BWY07_01998 [Candidatus Hydrogenedentes bacterium ADurb.Bin170]|nr:MAG: hypothetical protein BWY07_01998 [Candidatus Hydrogenedentes bacterium ADurb.Bin170]
METTTIDTKELIKALFKYGVNEATAKQLVKADAAETIRQLDALPFREGVRQAAPFLIDAIRKKYPLPADLTQKKEEAAKRAKFEQERTLATKREEYRLRFLNIYFEYLQQHLEALQIENRKAYKAFQKSWNSLAEMLTQIEPDQLERLRLIEFEQFAQGHAELGIASFWEWDERYNLEREEIKLQEPAAPEEPEPEPAAFSIKRGGKVDIVALAQERATFFHDLDDNHFADVRVADHIETYPLESRSFRIWLAGQYFNETGQPLYGDTLKEAVATLAAIARYAGQTQEVCMRIAEAAGNIYFDLSDSQWRAVEISAAGWRIIPAAETPVRFLRRLAQAPLPEPARGGRLDELRSFMNTGDDDTWTLISSWLAMTINPSGPFPLLMITGEQGSAKSTATKLLKACIDPHKAEIRALPKDERDLMIAAQNSWVLAFDNLSGINQETSDCLCRIATGATFATRKLHSDQEESIMSVKRPMVTNGIIDTNDYPDLLDRALSIFLPSISDSKRREERELWTGFYEARPRILGALFDAAASALKIRDQITLERRPRMADFARWSCAAESGLGLQPGAFWKAFDRNRAGNHEKALDNPLAIELCRFIDMQEGKAWQGKATELHQALTRWLTGKNEFEYAKHWFPRSPNALSGKLRRIAPNLRAIGYEMECGRNGGGSTIAIKRCL